MSKSKVWTTLSPVVFVGMIMAVASIVFGCSGGRYYQSHPTESQVGSDTFHYHNAVQLNLPATMFYAAQTITWMEMCKTRVDDPQTEAEFLYPFRECVRDGPYQLTNMGSVASQFVTPVITTAEVAGGMIGMGYFIGAGLGKSGDTVTQQSGGAQSNASASAKGGNAENAVNSGNRTTVVKPQTNINSNNVFKK